ncbi:hypothetical protein EVAR_40258_1 [Eumeta japonica]|uniref:Uncharacterized protein n=1 Tax=Eumeta variegata TaxID=151549 RepID=A0A4C1Y1N2_EUMVA|nr:hypothetical protein EVAR_40258_1 [Eumeta japonica]
MYARKGVRVQVRGYVCCEVARRERRGSSGNARDESLLFANRRARAQGPANVSAAPAPAPAGRLEGVSTQ